VKPYTITRRQFVGGIVGAAASTAVTRLLGARESTQVTAVDVVWSSTPRHPVSDILAVQRRAAATTGFGPSNYIIVPPGFEDVARLAFPDKVVGVLVLAPSVTTPVQVRARRLRLMRAYLRETTGDSDGMRYNRLTTKRA
jgi:hypothetical protein